MMGALMAVVQVSVSTGAVILVLLGVRSQLHKRYPARLLCIIWALLALRLLLPVQLTWPQGAVQVELPIASASYSVTTLAENVPLEQTLEPLAGAAAGQAPAAQVSVGQVLFAIWAAVAVLAAVWQMAAYGRFCRQVRKNGHVVTDQALLAVLAEEKGRLAIRRPIALVQTAAVKGPLLMGFVRPQLLVPAEGLRPAEAAFVFRHELTHYKRRDLWFKLLLCAARCVHWFDPAVYLLVRAAGEDMELACDNAVAKELDREARYQYGQCILHAAAGGKRAQSSLTTCFNGGKEGMKMRLREVMSQQPKKRGLVLLAAVLASVLILGGCFALGQKEVDSQAYRNEQYGFTLEIPEEIAQGLFRIESVSARLSGPAKRLDAVGFDYSVLTAEKNAGKTPEGFDAGGLLFAVELYPAAVGDQLAAEDRTFLAQDERYAYYFWQAQPDGVEGSFDDLLIRFAEAIAAVRQSFAPGEGTQPLMEAASQWGEALRKRDGAALAALTAGDTEEARQQKLAQILGVEDAVHGIGQSSPWITGFAVQAVDAKERTATMVYDWYAAGAVNWRTAMRLHFTAEGAPLVESAEVLAAESEMGEVTSLARFELLYGNDLGLPDALPIWANDSVLALEPQSAAASSLHLAGGQWVKETPYSAGGQEAGVTLTYRFADGETLTLDLLEQFGQGYLVQDWQRADGTNSRTPRDLAEQWARGLAHKSGQYRYPLLSEAEQAKFVQARVEQNSDDTGHWGWKIGGSSPTVRRYLVEAGASADTLHLVYAAWDSTPHEYRFDETLTFGRDDNGRLVIVNTTQGYDYAPDIGAVDTLETFRALYDNGLGLPAYDEEELAYLQTQADQITPESWYDLSGGTLGEDYEENGVRYVPYTFADGQRVTLATQMIRPHADLPPLWIPIGWQIGE